MEIQEFADKHRLRTRIDQDLTKIIPGRVGHLYEYNDDTFGVMVMPNPPRRQYWGFTRPVLLAAGLKVVQDGDGEGAATFNPSNAGQVKAAIRAAGVRRKRFMSPEQREKCVERLEASRRGVGSDSGRDDGE